MVPFKYYSLSIGAIITRTDSTPTRAHCPPLPSCFAILPPAAAPLRAPRPLRKFRAPPSRGAVRQRPPGHGAATCPERGNGSAQPFTAPARRLTESIRQDRPSAAPPRSPLPLPPPPTPLLPSPSLFCQVYIRPNYFGLGCQSCFPDRSDHP